MLVPICKCNSDLLFLVFVGVCLHTGLFGGLIRVAAVKLLLVLSFENQIPLKPVLGA